MLYFHAMTQLLPPGGSPEKSENSSGFGQMSNKEKENYLHIQRAIGLEVCNLSFYWKLRWWVSKRGSLAQYF
jgi:hypothetical protein